MCGFFYERVYIRGGTTLTPAFFPPKTCADNAYREPCMHLLYTLGTVPSLGFSSLLFAIVGAGTAKCRLCDGGSLGPHA